MRIAGNPPTESEARRQQRVSTEKPPDLVARRRGGEAEERGYGRPWRPSLASFSREGIERSQRSQRPGRRRERRPSQPASRDRQEEKEARGGRRRGAERERRRREREEREGRRKARAMGGASLVPIGDAPDRGAREALSSSEGLAGSLSGALLCGEPLHVGAENRGEEGIGRAVREGGDRAEQIPVRGSHGSEGTARGRGGHGREGREGEERERGEALRPPLLRSERRRRSHHRAEPARSQSRGGARRLRRSQGRRLSSA